MRICEFIRIGCILLILAICCVIVLRLANDLSTNQVEQLPEQTTEDNETTVALEEPPDMDISSVRGGHGELVFVASMEDYIESYNYIYKADHQDIFLRELPDWSRLEYDSSPYSEYSSLHYEFKHNVKVHTEPTISAYVSAEDGQIQEICLGFPEHGWTDYGYDLFVEECQYTFRLFFPEFDSEEISALFDVLFEDAYREVCYIDIDEERAPTIIHYQSSVGVYALLHCGMIKFCIIPVEQAYLNEFTNNGGTVYEIEK